MNIAVLVMSCDARSHLWPGFTRCFGRCWGRDIDASTYMSTESAPLSNGFEPIHTGPGTWTERVRISLSYVPDHINTIFFMQEDHWPVTPMLYGRFNALHAWFNDLEMLAYRCCHWSPLYTIKDGYFTSNSQYLLNHQPSFWKRDFLLDCMSHDEDPWKNETKGTKRLHKLKLTKRIGFEYMPWYLHVCRKGSVTPEGRAILNDLHLE